MLKQKWEEEVGYQASRQKLFGTWCYHLQTEVEGGEANRVSETMTYSALKSMYSRTLSRVY